MYLKINDGEKDLYFKVEKSEISIGRSENCDIPVAASGISREHIKLFQQNGTIHIEDCKTTNGTFINDEKITSKKEFNTFFPAKLGFFVTVELLNESDPAKLDELVKKTSEEY